MTATKKPDPTIIVIFGASGDLTWRKLVPSLYSLAHDGWLPDRFAVVGFGRNKLSADKFRERMRDGVAKFSRYGRPGKKEWDEFARQLSYQTLDLSQDETYRVISDAIHKHEKSWECQARRVYYLAIPPGLVGTTVDHLSKAGLCRDCERDRVVVEKPFGHDLSSAQELNKLLLNRLAESQVYRIDHYLGKETVQNILAFRFANALFEPIWDRRYIDHVQITVAESVGIGHRARYYERMGALRDMVQNHLMQVLCLIAMEPPVSFNADEIRSRKVDVLHAIRPIPDDDVALYAARGQYAAGWLRGEHVPGYRDEPNVEAESNTETFAALKLFVDNWRWQNVPIYLRTGKRLPARVSEVSIHFRPVPHQAFPHNAIADMQPNCLAIHIQPDEGVLLRFEAKRPGLRMRLSPVDMRFDYGEAFEESPPEAYETLLLDVMEGDSTQFMRADQIEAAWSVIMPVLNAWEQTPPTDFPNYQAGTWGMQAASVLIAQDGRSWRMPTAAQSDADAKENEE